MRGEMTKFYAIVFAFVLAFMIGGTAIYVQWQDRPNPCGLPAMAGADVGGPFDLVNSYGETVTDEDVIDRPALVYFGYTFCPDVCPFDMAKNANATDLLAEAGHDVRLVFVTVDPDRDTPEMLDDFRSNMYPDMVALTGSDAQIRKAAAAYRVYYSRGSGPDEFYLVDHSTFTYLMMPGNELVAFFRRDNTAADIAEKAACYIENNE